MTNKTTTRSLTADLLQHTPGEIRLMPAEGFHSGTPVKLLQQLKEASDIARKEKKPLTARVLVSDFDLPELVEKISALGFKKVCDRAEYIRALDDSLPGEEEAVNSGGVPLTWVPGLKTYGMEELGAIYKGAVTGDASLGDLSGLTHAEFGKDLQGDLADDAFQPTDDAIQIGRADGIPAAFVFAQVTKRPVHLVTPQGTRAIEGWSRLTYMGILPEFRGRGYGRQAHRHGLLTLRAIGGITYHGGTARENVRMRRLFESSGCAVLRMLEEWRFLPA